MSLGRYVLGLTLLIVVVGSSALGGLRLRRRLLPRWTGAPARLAEAIIALTIVLGVAELLGAVGLLRMPLVVAGCVACGLAVGRGPWSREMASEQRPQAPAVPAYGTGIAIAAGILMLAQWSATLSATLHGGMTGPDTLGYHGPIAATFVQRASIVHPPFINTDPAIAFFPATSELIHAVGILLFSRDVLSPFINLAWLGLALLAAWCVGRPRGMGPASLLVMAVLLNAPVFSSSQPSSGDNDVMALALLLSSLALLFNAEALDKRGTRTVASSPAVIALAGIAAGFALATKVTMLAPVGLFVIAGLVALSGRRSRLTWLISVLAASGIWFLRNLIAFGNPVPAVRLGIGPLALPSAHVPGSGTTVADYLTDGAVWRELLLPSLHAGFTFMWPVILGAALVGAIAGTVRGFTRFDRLLGMVAVLSAVAYAVTPRTGFPFLVAINLRYLAPALVFGLVLLFRIPGAGLFRRPWVLVLLAAGVVIDLADRGVGPRISGVALLGPTPHFVGTTAMWIGVLLAVAAASLILTGRTVTIRAWIALLALVVLGTALRPAAQTYLRTRYSTGPLAFARLLHHERIAVVGGSQWYPAFGLDLSNSVTQIAHHGPHGSQTLIRTCREWRRALTTGGYRYVITSPPYRLVFSSAPDYAAWTRSDPAAQVIEVTPDGLGGATSVFRLRGPLHPDGCAAS